VELEPTRHHLARSNSLAIPQACHHFPPVQKVPLPLVGRAKNYNFIALELLSSAAKNRPLSLADRPSGDSKRDTQTECCV